MPSPDREPALDDMLTDPMTQALMASDGTDAAEIKDILAAVRRRFCALASGTGRR